jgi:hypothetical protein
VRREPASDRAALLDGLAAIDWRLGVGTALSGTHGTRPVPAQQGAAWPARWLAEVDGITAFDLDVLLLAVAAAVDTDVSRYCTAMGTAGAYPTAGLALELLCDDREERLHRRQRLTGDAPLLRHGLVTLAGATDVPLLDRAILPDSQLVEVLCGGMALAPALRGCAELLTPLPPDRDWFDEDVAAFVDAAATQLGGAPMRVHFVDACGEMAATVAEAIAARAGVPLLVADGRRLGAASTPEPLRLVVRAAWLHDALLLLADACGHTWTRGELAVLRAHPGPVLTAGQGVSMPFDEAAVVALAPPRAATRRRVWHDATLAAGGDVDRATLEVLGRFPLPAARIAAVVEAATTTARLRTPPTPPLGGDLVAAVRAHSGRALDALATRIEPRRSFDDLVLPPEVRSQLRAICQRVTAAERVLDAWELRRAAPGEAGVTALFAGSPGTGKTMAAEVIAGELGLDLFRIDLSTLISKWVGETEKNLTAVFAAAEDTNAILLFDEADALFGKRTEVRGATDRYANMETAHLLQEMECYGGVAILATNLRQQMDDAFTRRLTFTVHFPFPDEVARRSLWQQAWPPAVPVDPTLDLTGLARRFALSGGNIRNIAIAAAFLAADGTGVVGAPEVLLALRREYAKLGQSLPDVEVAVLLVPEAAADADAPEPAGPRR